ncbi:hypothetical protein AM493_10935 [Flavobacterium akiainvivens]|uniref:Uncharacterized protein n=2 Tax=Flavobacterium akiainvivens TaxID=1202724 RepID=A0A0M9VID7_9FLAO|nr:hypothetical protein AM493_10935 [Flavobacterium akiainvivens]
MAVGCQSQKTIATTEPMYKPLSEVQSVNMGAQNYNNKRFKTDTVYLEKPSKFKSFNDVNGVDMGAQNYNNRRFTTDTIYVERIEADSLKN